MTTATRDRLVDAHAVAEYLGVSYPTICRWASQRLIPSVKLGGVRRFRLSKIEEWVREQEKKERRR